MPKERRKTLYDFRDHSEWIRKLSFSDHELRQVAVHREQQYSEPMISLPVDEPRQQGNGVRYVFQREVRPKLWGKLIESLPVGREAGKE